jgi:hypothetical protein
LVSSVVQDATSVTYDVQVTWLPVSGQPAPSVDAVDAKLQAVAIGVAPAGASPSEASDIQQMAAALSSSGVTLTTVSAQCDSCASGQGGSSSSNIPIVVIAVLCGGVLLLAVICLVACRACRKRGARNAAVAAAGPAPPNNVVVVGAYPALRAMHLSAAHALPVVPGGVPATPHAVELSLVGPDRYVYEQPGAVGYGEPHVAYEMSYPQMSHTSGWASQQLQPGSPQPWEGAQLQQPQNDAYLQGAAAYPAPYPYAYAYASPASPSYQPSMYVSPIPVGIALPYDQNSNSGEGQGEQAATAEGQS